jgi:hypothetical protein
MGRKRGLVLFFFGYQCGGRNPGRPLDVFVPYVALLPINSHFIYYGVWQSMNHRSKRVAFERKKKVVYPLLIPIRSPFLPDRREWTNQREGARTELEVMQALGSIFTFFSLSFPSNWVSESVQWKWVWWRWNAEVAKRLGSEHKKGQSPIEGKEQPRSMN